MTRQCAWCDCVLGLGTSGTHVMHGICERCAEDIRRAMRRMKEEETPRTEGILLATKATLRKVFIDR